MQPKLFLVVTAVFAAVAGILFIVFPAQSLGMVGAMGAGLIAQILGAEAIGFAVLNFFSRNLEDGEALRTILLANFVSSLLDFLLTVLYGITSGINTLGWISAIIYLLFALASGYLLFVRPSGASAREHR